MITVAQENEIPIDEKDKILEIIQNTKSGEAFKKAVSEYSPDLGKLIKGQIWGEALTKYAQEHYEKFRGRTISEIFKMIYGCKNFSYELSKKCKLDPNTGEIIVDR